MSKTDAIIRESFLLIDKDFDGSISLNELMYALRFIGVPFDYSMIEEKNNMKYSLGEYVQIAKKHLGTLTPEEQFINTIKKFDKKNDGTLAIDTTIHLVMTMSDILCDEDLINFKKFIDPYDKKMIPMEEFANKVFSQN
ncbi:calmodulin, putative [Plasmodium gallinaceum]|uniref:Calmodulin, putative n=1 Tax=Plasmodium gallinaceum TaxID=5849 RepID=A0A1J1GT49_PLAGA|nr:calmodulin, putative [Plasmodium gallinaceum]CRG95702.1 calmodulin, putative [Plasmodium gallinaceum]